MATAIDKLKRIFRQGDIVVRFICVNTLLFVVFAFVRVILKLFNVIDPSWLDFLALPAAPSELLYRPWALFTYMFMHVNAWHLFFNMLWLWCFGKIFLQFFSARHLRGLYIVAGLSGGLLFLLAFNVFPLFAAKVDESLLVGASAAILGIVIAVAVREPEYKISLFFGSRFSLKWLAVITVAVDVLLAASSNAGGHFAHLGGALAGWGFAKGLEKGHDITAWMNAILDLVGGLFQPELRRTKHLKQKRKRTRKPKRNSTASSPQNDHAADYRYNETKKQQSDEIDGILEKIKLHGYSGLSEEEKLKLFDASRKR